MQGNKEQLLERLGKIGDVKFVLGLLNWDQCVYMPPKAAAGRAFQTGTLSSIQHQQLTDPALGKLLYALRDTGSLAPEMKLLVREALYDYERAIKLPAAFIQEFSVLKAQAYSVWVEARKQSDFSMFEPILEKLALLWRQKADLLGYEGSPYNALLEDFERGMTAEQLKPIFEELAEKQSDLIRRVMNASDNTDFGWLDQTWDTQAQSAFSLDIVAAFGYDLNAGRQDLTVHPFCAGLGSQDVRLTTRFNPKDLFNGMLGSFHECGHGLYELGFLESDWRTPLAEPISLGIHESQSRMWENIIGRSLHFWRYGLPLLRNHFPGQLGGITPEQIHRAINRVQPSFIRVEADECTYNLHIIIRFEIETALIEQRMKVKDIPEVWNEKMKHYLGLDVPNDALGCLQDVHWSYGVLGYFPTYALGNLNSAQLFEKIHLDVPDIWGRVEQGDFAPLLSWLREKVHHVGRRKTAVELMTDVTGATPSARPYLNYLESKYSALYDLK